MVFNFLGFNNAHNFSLPTNEKKKFTPLTILGQSFYLIIKKPPVIKIYYMHYFTVIQKILFCVALFTNHFEYSSHNRTRELIDTNEWLETERFSSRI